MRRLLILMFMLLCTSTFADMNADCNLPDKIIREMNNGIFSGVPRPLFELIKSVHDEKTDLRP